MPLEHLLGEGPTPPPSDPATLGTPVPDSLWSWKVSDDPPLEPQLGRAVTTGTMLNASAAEFVPGAEFGASVPPKLSEDPMKVTLARLVDGAPGGPGQTSTAARDQQRHLEASLRRTRGP